MTNTASLRARAGRPALLLAGVLVVALLATGADAAPATRPTDASAVNAPSTYSGDITWDDVAAEPTKTVVKVTAENCLCDLTEGTCDANCCCDTDCDSNEKAQFSECASCVYDGTNAAMDGKVCLPEGRSPPSLEYCLPSSTVSRVNLLSSSSLGSVEIQKADQSFLSQQLCIKDDNSASLGKYFLDPGFATEDTLKSAVTLKSEKFWNPVPAAASETQSKYRHNDTVGVVISSGGSEKLLPGNKFVLPGATLSGVCGWTNVIGYNMPLPASSAAEDSTCLVPIDSLSTMCTTILSAKYLVNNVKLAKTPGSSATATAAPTISSMKYRSRIDGVLTDTTGGTDATEATLTKANGDKELTCDFAVVEAHYVVTHDGSGTIESFAVDLVFADVMNNAAWDALYGSSSLADSGNPSSVRVKHTVTWKLSAETVVPRSGAPGYVVGAPLLAGYKETNSGKDAVARLKEGLAIPGAGPDGRCSVNSKSTVRFGMSQSSSCAVPLSQNNLADFCQGTGDKAVKDFLYQLITVNGVNGESATPANANAPASSVPLPAQLMDGLLYGTTDANYDLSGKTVMVAAWANANFENIADWTSCDTSDTTDCATELTTTEQLSAPSGDLVMSWDDTTKTCKNVAVGVHIDVLTAKVGHLDHAQSKVQRVQVGWNYADWTYTDFPWDDAGDGVATDRQNFMMKSTVHFVEMAQDAPEGVKPASPPVLPSLPADVFYPFLSAGPAGGRAAASAAWCVALVVAIFVALVTARGD